MDSTGRSSRGSARSSATTGATPIRRARREGAVNSAGAGGPMQFLASTWARYGVDAEGEGRPDRWDPADAIYGAANYLRASGAPRDYRKAIFAYNHADWYVAEVEHWAALYRAAGPKCRRRRTARVAGSRGADRALERRERRAGALRRRRTRAALARRRASSRSSPRGVPAAVQAMVIAGNELQDLPYGPAGHPDPLGRTERGLLEHGQLRALPLRHPPARGNPAATIRSPRNTSTGASRDRAMGDDLRDHRAHRSRVHRDRRTAPGHELTTAPTSVPIATKAVRAGASSITSRRGRTGRCATRRGCEVSASARGIATVEGPRRGIAGLAKRGPDVSHTLVYDGAYDENPTSSHIDDELSSVVQCASTGCAVEREAVDLALRRPSVEPMNDRRSACRMAGRPSWAARPRSRDQHPTTLPAAVDPE